MIRMQKHGEEAPLLVHSISLSSPAGDVIDLVTVHSSGRNRLLTWPSVALSLDL